MLYAIITVLFIGMNNGFRVAICTEVMPAFLEFFLKLTIVIDFAIEDDQDALIFVEDGLLAASHVNDRKTAHTECNSISSPDSLTIWAAMADDLAHVIYELLCAIATALYVDKTRYSAHGHISLASKKGRDMGIPS